MNDLIDTPIGAIGANVLLFWTIGLLFLTGYFLFRPYKFDGHTEKKLSGLLLMILLMDAFPVIIVFSSIIPDDGFRWFYSQWLSGLLITIMIALAIWFYSRWIAKTKGDITDYL